MYCSGWISTTSSMIGPADASSPMSATGWATENTKLAARSRSAAGSVASTARAASTLPASARHAAR